MIPQLHVLERQCTHTPGALIKLVLIDPDDLVSQPDWHLVPTVDELDFIPGKGAYEFGMKRLNGRLSDNTNTGSDGGDFFEYTLDARVRKVTPEMEYLRAKLRNRRIHVVGTYYDGTERLVTNMRLTAKGDSGEKPSGFNGYTITGTAQLEKPAPYIGVSPDITPGTGGPPPGASDSAGEMVMESFSTSDATDTFSLPSNVLLTAIFIKSNADQSPYIGLTAGGDELGGPQDILANQGYTFAQSLRSTAITTIHFTGLAGANQIEVWYAQLGEGDVVIIDIATTDAEYEYELPSGILLAAVWVRGSLAQTVSIGLTSEGDELGGPQDLLALEGHTFAQTLRTETTTSIFISGLTGSNSIEIWYYV